MRQADCASLLPFYADFYPKCCRPEVLREVAWKNSTSAKPGRHAGIARQRLPHGNPACWQQIRRRPSHGYMSCCSFVYHRILAVDFSGRKTAVRFLPWKSTRHFEVDLKPVVSRRVIIRQRQFRGSQFGMAGYSGVLWPGSLALADALLHQIMNGRFHQWGGRCIELGAGSFALPSLVASSSRKFTKVIATDLPGVVDTNMSKAFNVKPRSLDMCSDIDIKRRGRFDVILTSDAATQSNCGPKALISLSTRGTLVHAIVRDEHGDVDRQKFLLDNFFIEMYRLDLEDVGQMQPGEAAYYVVWQRIYGPHTCWQGAYTFNMCCGQQSQQNFGCFDEIYTEALCCGAA